MESAKQEKPVINNEYALYNDDCIEVMEKLPSESVHLSIYSPPFIGLYVYSSSDRDLSNCRNADEFMQHYEYVVSEIERLTLPGRLSLVHCMDVPLSNTGRDSYMDFPGEIIRLHNRLGFEYCGRHAIWKEPLAVRNRTMAKNLAHKTIVEDSTLSGVAGADYLLSFRKQGDNKIPVSHPHGLLEYAGSQEIPSELLRYRGWTGNQIENRYSHWIWRQYASSFWNDVRVERVLPYKAARDEQDEKHVHPLQLDVVDRAVVLYSNPGEVVLTPFLGVGSEAYGAVYNERRAIGIELKPTYFKQACRNLEMATADRLSKNDQQVLNFESTKGATAAAELDRACGD